MGDSVPERMKKMSPVLRRHRSDSTVVSFTEGSFSKAKGVRQEVKSGSGQGSLDWPQVKESKEVKETDKDLTYSSVDVHGWTA